MLSCYLTPGDHVIIQVNFHELLLIPQLFVFVCVLKFFGMLPIWWETGEFWALFFTNWIAYLLYFYSVYVFLMDHYWKPPFCFCVSKRLEFSFYLVEDRPAFVFWDWYFSHYFFYLSLELQQNHSVHGGGHNPYFSAALLPSRYWWFPPLLFCRLIFFKIFFSFNKNCVYRKLLTITASIGMRFIML